MMKKAQSADVSGTIRDIHFKRQWKSTIVSGKNALWDVGPITIVSAAGTPSKLKQVTTASGRWSTDVNEPAKSTHNDGTTPLHVGFPDNTVKKVHNVPATTSTLPVIPHTIDGPQILQRRRSTHNDGTTPLHAGFPDNTVKKVHITSGVAFYSNVIAKQVLENVKIENKHNDNKRHNVHPSSQAELPHVNQCSMCTCSMDLIIAKRLYTYMWVLGLVSILSNIYNLYFYWCQMAVT